MARLPPEKIKGTITFLNPCGIFSRQPIIQEDTECIQTDPSKKILTLEVRPLLAMTRNWRPAKKGGATWKKLRACRARAKGHYCLKIESIRHRRERQLPAAETIVILVLDTIQRTFLRTTESGPLPMQGWYTLC